MYWTIKWERGRSRLTWNAAWPCCSEKPWDQSDEFEEPRLWATAAFRCCLKTSIGFRAFYSFIFIPHIFNLTLTKVWRFWSLLMHLFEQHGDMLGGLKWPHHTTELSLWVLVGSGRFDALLIKLQLLWVLSAPAHLWGDSMGLCLRGNNIPFTERHEERHLKRGHDFIPPLHF